MAKARSSSGPALIKQHDYSHIIGWYRETLPRVAPPPAARWEPIRIGPTWDWSPERGWNLPEHSMGWELLGWCGYWLRDAKGQEWQYTPEQARFLLWYEALDDEGRLLYRTAVLQRLKGWGKDPLACGLAAAKAFAPVIFDHWGADGQPVGRDDNAAWVQITAVSKKQTGNTMKLFPVMIPQETRTHYGIQIGRENVWGLGDTRQIEATSSNFLAIEGNRVTQAIRNEPQNWNDSNQGHELAGAVSGNSTKIPDNLGRILDIENAFRPGTDSVAERIRDAWEQTQSTEDRDATAEVYGLLYDSLEAPAEAPLTLDTVPEVVEAVRGDSTWLDTRTITDTIARGEETPSESRRKWFNQITASADAWTMPQEFDPNYRDEVVEPGTPILMFGDGSKSDDYTAAVGCRISDGLVFPIGIWLPRKVKQGKREIAIPVERARVDHDIRAALDMWNVHGFWFDPSDARDEETGERYWEPYCDAWANDYSRKLKRLPAVKQTAHAGHLVIWDMRNTLHLQRHTEACERALSDIIGMDAEGVATPTPLLHNCPQPTGRQPGGFGVMMRQHVLNSRRRPNKFGVGIGKEHRESRKKVDASVCMVGVRMMWHYYRSQQKKGRTPGDGSVTTWSWR